MLVMIVNICSFGFVDLRNIKIDTKIIAIGAEKADLSAKVVFRGGHFEYLIFGGNRWSDDVVPAIFEISVPKNPQVQIFMLLSRSAHLCR